MSAPTHAPESAPCERSALLTAAGPVRHGFFGRAGGQSRRPYAELNISQTVGDDAHDVAANRAKVVATLGGGALVTLRQVHSHRVLTLQTPEPPAAAIEADALVTRQPGLLLGILTADCAPLLFFDPVAGIIGAAHAGWRGAIGGIMETTVCAMEALGAARTRIHLAIGPTISGANYEVGTDFMNDILARRAEARDSFFTPPSGRPHFDLPKFLLAEAARAGLAATEQVGPCTYGAPERYFSHRFATQAGTATGRQIALIGLV